MAPGPLEGRVALITGAGSSIGMGREMALALVEAGARVGMMDIDPEPLERSVNDAREIGGDGAALGIAGDVSSWDDAQRAVRECVDDLGGLHILINNAGVRSYGAAASGDGAFWDVAPQEWARVLTVNANGPFLMTRAAIDRLRAQGWGRIIGVTTSLDTMIRGNNLPYGPSKAAHEAFVASIAQELEGAGVTANVLVPGGGTNTHFIPDDPSRDRASLIQPDVMRAPAVWLASSAADGVNGQRFIAALWDERLPIEERLARAGAPAAWRQLGRRPIPDAAGERR